MIFHNFDVKYENANKYYYVYYSCFKCRVTMANIYIRPIHLIPFRFLHSKKLQAQDVQCTLHNYTAYSYFLYYNYMEHDHYYAVYHGCVYIIIITFYGI